MVTSSLQKNGERLMRIEIELRSMNDLGEAFRQALNKYAEKLAEESDDYEEIHRATIELRGIQYLNTYRETTYTAIFEIEKDRSL
jgi:histone H3/H4